MIVSDNTIQAEGVDSFLENLGRSSAKAVKIFFKKSRQVLGKNFKHCYCSCNQKPQKCKINTAGGDKIISYGKDCTGQICVIYAI